RRCLTQGPSDRAFIALRIEGARCDERARSRTAYAGVAVNDQRPCAIPALHKSNEPGYVLIRRSDITVEWLRDIIQPQDKVVRRRNCVGSADEVDILK